MGPAAKVKMEFPSRREPFSGPPGRPQNPPKNESSFEGAPGPPFRVPGRLPKKKVPKRCPKSPPKRLRDSSGNRHFWSLFLLRAPLGHLWGPKWSQDLPQEPPGPPRTSIFQDFWSENRRNFGRVWRLVLTPQTKKKWRALRPVFLTLGEPFGRQSTSHSLLLQNSTKKWRALRLVSLTF